MRNYDISDKLNTVFSLQYIKTKASAGIIPGRKIASKFISGAASDGAGAPIITPGIWAQLETQTAAKGETPWKSLEITARPPMLPLFGKVKSFLMTPEMVIANPPAPPPSSKSVAFKKELAEIKSYSENTARKNMQIVTFWADGVGTSTPPRHWNAIASQSFIDKNYSEVRWARNMALLNIAMMDAAISCWDTKNTQFNPTPCQADPSTKTMTGTPNFPAFVSGHSTFSGAACVVLSHMIPEKAQNYKAMANEASVSRMLGCIHYKSDCEKGLELGEKVGGYAVARALTDGAE